MNNKRNYMAESSFGYQYADTPLAAITGLLNIHKRDWKGRTTTINVYDTTDVPKNGRVFTNSSTGEKMWSDSSFGALAGKTGKVMHLFTLLDDDSAEFMFGKDLEHVTVNREYFERISERLRVRT
jgi:hypothetical protein